MGSDASGSAAVPVVLGVGKVCANLMAAPGRGWSAGRRSVFPVVPATGRPMPATERPATSTVTVGWSPSSRARGAPPARRWHR